MIDTQTANPVKPLLVPPTEEELIALCREDVVRHTAVHKYTPAERYGMGRHIREYGFYPTDWPMHIMTDHAPALRDWVWYEQQFSAPAQFFHSPNLVKEWKKVSDTPCYVLYSPFVFYRRRNRIRQRKDARGTLVFPTHNSHHLKDKSDIEAYIEQLLALPEEFQPISACLYFLDILEGKHKSFQKHGISVYTAGNWMDPEFAVRFYSIIRHFRYTTSNLPGSYMFYSTEMGIPFSLYGNQPYYVNESDPSLESGTYNEFWEWPRVKEAVQLFQGLHTEVTSAQRRWVEAGLGMKEGVSRLKMAAILYQTWYAHEYKASKTLKAESVKQHPSLWLQIKRKGRRLANKYLKPQ